MNLLRRLFRRAPDPALVALAGKIDDLESRLHHLEVQNRNLLARLGAVEGDLAWIVRPDEQPLPAPADLPEGVVYHHKK
jgi:CII-binding regulator of phage lambda lysogenization HflD